MITLGREIILKGLGQELAEEIETQGLVKTEDFLKRLLVLEKSIALRNFLEEFFPGIQLLETYSNFYCLEMPRNDKSIGFLFGKIEEVKAEMGIVEYAVAQTSLEQIFNNFARQ